MATKPNLALFAPVVAAGLAVTTLLVLAAHARGKRRERKAWLIGRSTP